MKERKYQPIFSKETKIRIGNDLVKGAGSTFKKLITNLLDTEKLYNDLEKYGLLQFTRSGRIAVSKEKMGISEILNTFTFYFKY